MVMTPEQELEFKSNVKVGIGLMLLIAGIISACGNMRAETKVKYHSKKPAIAAAARPYVNNFYRDMGLKAHPQIPVRFAKRLPNKKRIGECRYNVNRRTGAVSNRRIILVRSAWKRMNRQQREWLVYHELGHCALQLKHDNRHFRNGCPVSIMKSSIDASCYTGNKPAYIRQLKKLYYEAQVTGRSRR